MTELLSPAGSLESLKAAVNAGADAVYIGGQKFGARAYAQNPDRAGLVEGIEYCHLRGRKCYLTLNTLLKEEELRESLTDFLDPLYLNGLDAVIIQDLGVLKVIRARYPDLAVHASTQMSLTTPEGAELLLENGVSRIIPARELSLTEIRDMTARGIEVETFIHGAMCYCYSGRCLFSSMLGGRSGNRGKCAQPCRKKYDGEEFLLSMKDLCTIDLLPDLIDAGIFSFKIEGRMKQSDYTAGVTAIYRKYIDRYELKGREGYRVDPQDRQTLLFLFNRSGFTEGYYREKNGPGMLEVPRSTAQRKQAVFIDKGNSKVKINGDLRISDGRPAILTVWNADSAFGQEPKIVAEGEVPAKAKSAALTEDLLRKQMQKTGDTAFEFASLTITLEDGLFLPVQAVNELRRSALDELKRQILKSRDPRHGNPNLSLCPAHKKRALRKADKSRMRCTVSVTLPEQLSVLLDRRDRLDIDTVYFDSMLLGTKRETAHSCRRLADQIRQLHQNGILCYFIFPPVLRADGRKVLRDRQIASLLEDFDGFSVHSIDELACLLKSGCQKPVAAEEDLYSFNCAAGDFLRENGISRMTLSPELTEKELLEQPMNGRELIVYGYQPLMQSAQCLTKTKESCTGIPGIRYLTDQRKARFPVLNRCLFCTNTIYNSVPLQLLSCRDEIEQLSPDFLRLSFTVETAKETAHILDLYLRDAGNAAPSEGTRGHFKRGVE